MSGLQNSLARYIITGLTILLIVSNGTAGPLHPTKNAISVEATSKSLDPLPVAPRGKSGTHTTKRVKSSPTAGHTQVVKTGTSTKVKSHSTASRTRTGTSPTSTKPASHSSISTKVSSHSTATRTRTGTTSTPTPATTHHSSSSDSSVSINTSTQDTKVVDVIC